jgi:peptidoglycan L-alanyl-D-glutamate endopeptidase CwlK
MPSFGTSSRQRLDTCHPDLQRVFAVVVQEYDCSILEGERTQERQQELYRQGKSKLDGVSKKSKHQSSPSRAADVLPYPIDWQDTKRMYHFAGYVLAVGEGLGISLRWGGDWDGDIQSAGSQDQSFYDLPHFELK